jgi:patatin-like phospholipase/acyl hydrolase
MTLKDRINSVQPKKILSLDGGGIRGILTLEILQQIEAQLKKQLDRDDTFVLADYFDFISGTSTGAIIAAALSLGKSVEWIKDFYLDSGREMFDRAFILKRFRYKYKDNKLKKKLQEVFGKETELGSEEIKTILMMVMRNASTDSPWPVSNNPNAKYNARRRNDCNLEIPLWQLVRASTAAPVYFPPECVKIGPKKFIFVDGGITTYNNPAFQSFLMATIEPYRLQWATGENQILIVSVGTGTSPDANADLHPSEMNLIYNAGSVPAALMYAALNEQDMLCRVFGKCLAGDMLDREIGNLIGSRGPVAPKLFTYMRYNAELSKTGLKELGVGHITPEDVQQLDSIDHIDQLQEVGRAVAARKVKPKHFADFIP